MDPKQQQSAFETPSTFQEGQSPRILKEFPKSETRNKNALLIVLGSILVVLAGVGTGWVLSGKVGGASAPKEVQVGKGQSEVVGEVGEAREGVLEVEGKLVEGGIEGEGTHHLEREGGPSRYVYLTSTTIDLQGFVGKKVKVWGETISSAKAPWLMDVAKIKIIRE